MTAHVLSRDALSVSNCGLNTGYLLGLERDLVVRRHTRPEYLGDFSSYSKTSGVIWVKTITTDYNLYIGPYCQCTEANSFLSIQPFTQIAKIYREVIFAKHHLSQKPLKSTYAMINGLVFVARARYLAVDWAGNTHGQNTA